MTSSQALKLLMISDDIYKPVLVKEQILQPYFMQISLLRLPSTTVQLYQISAELPYVHYLELYSNVISTIDIIMFHLKQSTAKGKDFRKWLKVIPVGSNPRVVFVVESNVSTIMEDFRERVQRYWKKEVEKSVIWLNSTVDREGILKRVVEDKDKIVELRDYVADCGTISQVKAFLKFGVGKGKGNEKSQSTIV